MTESDLDLALRLRQVVEDENLYAEFTTGDLDETVAAGCSKCCMSSGGGNGTMQQA